MADYDPEDIAAALRKVQIRPGGVTFTHSNIGFFGRCAGATDAETLCNAFIDAFRQELGPSGTMVVPTFSYSFCWGRPFDPAATPSVCGMLAEAVRTHPEAKRSVDANFSVAALGPGAASLTDDAPSHSFGPGSFWQRLLEADGQIVNLNFDAGSTFLHYVERDVGVPYRYDKEFPGTLLLDGTPSQRTFTHFVYDHDRPEDAPDFAKFTRHAESAGAVRRAALGRGEIVAVDVVEVDRLVREGLASDRWFLRKGGGT